MEDRKRLVKSVTFASNLKTLDNVMDLRKIGAGHDGCVYQLEDKALKILKYDIARRKDQNLMTFEKAQFLVYYSNCFSRIVLPTDVLLDEDGIFCGYEMKYIDEVDRVRHPVGSFTNEQYLIAANELCRDFALLSSIHMEAKDINAGSFLYDEQFLHLCDTDKYVMHRNMRALSSINNETFHYVLAKILFWEMIKGNVGSKQKLIYYKWVTKIANDHQFLNRLNKEMGSSLNEPISEYAAHLSRKLIK